MRTHLPRVLVGVLPVVRHLGAPDAALAHHGWDTSPTALSTVPTTVVIGGQEPRIGMSAAGDVAVWADLASLTSPRVVRTARYEKARGAWTPATTAFSSTTHAAQDVRLAVDAAGNAVAVWTAFSAGLGNWEEAAPTGIRLFVSGVIAASLDLPLSESFAFDGVPPGTYTFAVSAVVGGTASAPSAPVTLSFPGTCAGTPLPPAAFSTTTQRGIVYLDWLPPALGEATTSYLISVTGSFTGSLPTAARTMAVPVPPGTYVIRVASTGPCGTSAPTAALTVIVP